MERSDRIFVSGHRGLLGSAVVAELKNAGYDNLLTIPHKELDLTQRDETEAFLKSVRPKAVIHCAALVGGIQANSSRPADFLFQNLMIQTNVIHGAHLADVPKLLFFGSNCMYPLDAKQPLQEASLLQGPIEPSNLAYGAAKIAGFVQCQAYHKQYGRDYFTVIPASLYGPNDCFDLDQCHVTPGLLLRLHIAKTEEEPTFTVWGTGKPRRELLFSEDAAAGVRALLESWTASMGPVNLGAGDDLTVAEIASTISQTVGFRGRMEFDLSKPDGNPRKLLDSSQIAKIGFRPKVGLREGLRKTYDWLLQSPTVRGLRAAST